MTSRHYNGHPEYPGDILLMASCCHDVLGILENMTTANRATERGLFLPKVPEFLAH